MMFQSANDNKLYSRTDDCNSRLVEEQLYSALQAAIVSLSQSAVFYEEGLRPGVSVQHVNLRDWPGHVFYLDLVE